MSEITQLSGRQIAAGRALAGLRQAELAEASSVSVPTLRRMEASAGPAAGLANNVQAVRAALERAGIVFLADRETKDGGPGVRLAQVAQEPKQGPVDAPMVRAGRKMKAEKI